MEPRQRQFSLWYVLAAMLLTLGIQHVLFAPHPANLSYSDFKALLRAGKVADLTVTERAIGGRVGKDGLEGVLPKETIEELQKSGQGERRFTTVRVDDPALVQDLEAAKVRFTGHVESVWLPTLLSWVVPALIFFALWGFLMKRLGPASGVLEIGKSKAKVYMEKLTGVTFDEREQTLNQLLVEMDGFNTDRGVIILAAAAGRWRLTRTSPTLPRPLGIRHAGLDPVARVY